MSATTPIFLTGGTGFIGRRVVDHLRARPDTEVRSLVRRVSNEHDGIVDAIPGDLLRPETYRDQLRSGDRVLHLAGLTGKAPRADYFAANTEATRQLIEACRRAGVSRFVYVSTIAATYRDTRGYPYAESKAAAEAVVAASGLDYVIVRPTIVLGADSPIWLRLRMLASLPILPIIGSGRARVQPIFVDDVARFLVAVATASVTRRAIDLGGPDVTTFEEFLKKIRYALVQRGGPVVHLPAGPLIGVLTIAERVTSSLPIGAGQLSAFVNDSVAEPDPQVSALVPTMTPLDEIVRQLVARG